VAAIVPRRLAGRQIMPSFTPIVERALAKDHAAVIVLGASHDLTENVRAVVGDGCEYIPCHIVPVMTPAP
jgi:hypothetical protein